MTKHATWLLNRYLVHDDGLTNYQCRLKSATSPARVEFAEKVHYTLHGRHNIAKGDPSCHTGLWLGRDPESGEHFIAARVTVVKARSIRRYTPSERFDVQLLRSLR